MSLSKERNKERMRLLRSVQPKSVLPAWVVQPNQYLKGHLSVCLDYTGNIKHFDNCPYINPLIRTNVPTT